MPMPRIISTLCLGAVLFLTVSTQATAATPPCPVGEARTLDPDFGVRLAAGPIVVACVQAPHYGRRELIGYREGKKLATSTLCVDTVFPDSSFGSCISSGDTVHGLGESFGFGATPDGAAAFNGFASLHVRTTTVRYSSHGKLRQQRAVITRVADQSLLATLGLSKPFAYYNVAVPWNARYLAFAARNKAGKLVFRRFIDGLPDPSREGEELGRLP